MIQVVNNATVEVNAYYREDSEYCAVGICFPQMDHLPAQKYTVRNYITRLLLGIKSLFHL